MSDPILMQVWRCSDPWQLEGQCSLYVAGGCPRDYEGKRVHLCKYAAQLGPNVEACSCADAIKGAMQRQAEELEKAIYAALDIDPAMRK